MPSDMRGYSAVPVSDYAQRTTSLVITPTSDATAADWLVGNSVFYPGDLRIRIETYAYACDITAGQQLIVNVWDGDIDLGRIAIYGNSASATLTTTVFGGRIITPSAGLHVYKVKVWKTGGTANIYANTGGVATGLPAFLSITQV